MNSFSAVNVLAELIQIKLQTLFISNYSNCTCYFRKLYLIHMNAHSQQHSSKNNVFTFSILVKLFQMFWNSRNDQADFYVLVTSHFLNLC